MPLGYEENIMPSKFHQFDDPNIFPHFFWNINHFFYVPNHNKNEYEIMFRYSNRVFAQVFWRYYHFVLKSFKNIVHANGHSYWEEKKNISYSFLSHNWIITKFIWFFFLSLSLFRHTASVHVHFQKKKKKYPQSKKMSARILNLL